MCVAHDTVHLLHLCTAKVPARVTCQTTRRHCQAELNAILVLLRPSSANLKNVHNLLVPWYYSLSVDENHFYPIRFQGESELKQVKSLSLPAMSKVFNESSPPVWLGR